MKLFRASAIAFTAIVAALPGLALAATITASQLLDKAHAPGFQFAPNNVLGLPDDGGRYLDQSWSATGESFIKLRMDQAFGMDGTSKRDLKIVNFSSVDHNNNQAAAIWVVVDGTAYNVGSQEVIRDTSIGINGVWDSPTGAGSMYRDRGWIVFGGTKGGKIDLDFFFGESGIYGTRRNLVISDIYVSGYYQDGVTTQNYDLDATKAFTIATVVPIPAAAWLFASGLFALIATARRRRA